MESFNSTKRRKNRKPYNDLFIIGVATLSFILVGLTITLSIRACIYHNKQHIEERHLNDSQSIIEPEVTQKTVSQYEMPDSIIWISMPRPLEGVSEMILHRTSYIASYNQETKLPNWVAWNLTSAHTDGPYKRLNYFHEDEDVPQPRATLDDYRGCKWSRGHMCPAGDNKWNAKAMFDTFSLINVCPQDINLNSGLWNSIEMDCRKWAKEYGEVYIVCGPVFLNKEHETIGENKIVVPEAFYKVILCLKGKPKAIGFIVRNNEGTKKKDQFVNTVDDVERITGIDFFPSLPDEIENEVEAYSNLEDWK